VVRNLSPKNKGIPVSVPPNSNTRVLLGDRLQGATGLAAVVEGDSHDDYQSQYQPRAHQSEDFTLSSQLQTYTVIEIFLHQKINGVCSAEYKAHKKQGRLLETLQDVVTCACRNIGMHVPEIERRRPRHQSVQVMMILATKPPSNLKFRRFVGY
jgi:hypothetical protein